MAELALTEPVEHVRLDDIDVTITPDMLFCLTARLGAVATHDTVIDVEVLRRLVNRAVAALAAYSIATGRRDL